MVNATTMSNTLGTSNTTIALVITERRPTHSGTSLRPGARGIPTDPEDQQLDLNSASSSSVIFTRRVAQTNFPHVTGGAHVSQGKARVGPPGSGSA